MNGRRIPTTRVPTVKSGVHFVALLALVAWTQVAVAAPKQPAFLPDYFSPAFEVPGSPLLFVSQSHTNGVDRFLYESADHVVGLGFENTDCSGEGASCSAILKTAIASWNRDKKRDKVLFHEVTATEFSAEVHGGNFIHHIFGFVLPSSAQIWVYSTVLTNNEFFQARYEQIEAIANRKRYEDALSAGNVAMGHWGGKIQEYARHLLRAGRKDEALTVLKNLLVTTPFNYEAHLDFMDNTADPAAATTSAKVVFKNAENPEFINRAAVYLKHEIKTLDAIPVLKTKQSGLRVILVPLAPCNPWLLDDVARLYEQITDVPVNVLRLSSEWAWGSPDRIYRQRDVQDTITKIKGQKIEFTNWTKDRYTTELAQSVQTKDPLSKYFAAGWIDQINKKPGQYLVDPYVNRFRDQVAPFRSSDQRTMFVGITEANIYSGDVNYLFSLGTEWPASADILSYYIMMGDTLHEEYQSRRRLTERIAKELVPASLKQLRIPRSTDPTCPYSYSSGVDRLDQKTLVLSDEVKDALRKLRDQASP